jgi:O-antigen ligase
LLVIAGLISCYTIINEEFWLLSAILAHFPLAIVKSEGISLLEVAAAIYIYIPLAVWFMRKIFVEKQNIVENFTDVVFLVFYLTCIFSFVFTKIYNFDTLLWFKELAVFSGYLIFFPLRDYYRKNINGLKNILVMFGILGLMIGVYNLNLYRNKVILATQFFQVWGSRVAATEQIFMFCILVVISIIFLIKSKKTQFILLCCLGIYFIALILSFTRSYFAFTLLGMFVLWLLFNKSDKKKMLSWVLGLTLIGILGIYLIFGDLIKTMFEAFVSRFTLLKGRDISFIQRVIETEAILKQIKENPILGWGLGAKFRIYDIFYETHILNSYAHNGYLYLWYKIGILGLASYVIFYISQFYTTIKNAIYEKDIIKKNIFFVFSFILFSFIFISITSPQFYHKPSILILSIIWAHSSSYKKKPLAINKQQKAYKEK